MSKFRGQWQRRWIGLSITASFFLAPGVACLFSLGEPVQGWAMTAYAQTATQPASGNVYVLSQGQWREAFVQLATGRISQGQPIWIYTVQYLDGTREVESGVTADRIQTLEAFYASESGQPEAGQSEAGSNPGPVYDVSSEAGIEQMLAAHNRLRREVDVSDLRWSAALATHAQQWAETLISERRMAHSPDQLRNNGEIGENITSRRNSGGAYSTPAQAVAGWVAERHDYDYASNRCAPGKQCGHYTQMVWADTTEVGCGVARSGDGLQEIWVCQYNPGGNVVGQRPY